MPSESRIGEADTRRAMTKSTRNRRALRMRVLAAATSLCVLDCRKHAAAPIADAALVPLPSAAISTDAGTVVEEEVRTVALANAWRDLQPSNVPCPVAPSATDDVTVVIDGRTTSGRRHGSPNEMIVVLDAHLSNYGVAKVYLWDRESRQMRCGTTMEVRGSELLRDAVRNARLFTLVPRTDASTP
jgi:hypothetical protein